MFLYYWHAALVSICCLLLAERASAQTYHWNPDNGHYYTFEFDRVTWESARTNAMQRSFAGVNGHLLTITSAAEQQFIESNFILFDKVWLGGFQPPNSPEPDGNWQWITSEPFTYAHWRPGEPNEAWDDENLLEMFPGGYWNDVGAIEIPSFPRSQPTRRYYLIEFSVPEPASFLSVATGTLAVFFIRRRPA